MSLENASVAGAFLATEDAAVDWSSVTASAETAPQETATAEESLETATAEESLETANAEASLGTATVAGSLATMAPDAETSSVKGPAAVGSSATVPVVDSEESLETKVPDSGYDEPLVTTAPFAAGMSLVTTAQQVVAGHPREKPGHVAATAQGVVVVSSVRTLAGVAAATKLTTGQRSERSEHLKSEIASPEPARKEGLRSRGLHRRTAEAYGAQESPARAWKTSPLPQSMALSSPRRAARPGGLLRP